MATNLDIIKRAMKKIHVLPAGSNPDSADAADVMDALQGLIVELIGQGSLGRLRDVLATTDYTARENERIQASHGITITLPTVIQPTDCDYEFWNWYPFGKGKPRPPYDRTAVIVIQDNVPVYNLWSTYQNEWIVINALGQQDDFPLAQYLENGFAAMLAERIADDFDEEVGVQTLKQANLCRAMLALKMDSQSSSKPDRAAYF